MFKYKHCIGYRTRYVSVRQSSLVKVVDKCCRHSGRHDWLRPVSQTSSFSL